MPISGPLLLCLLAENCANFGHGELITWAELELDGLQYSGTVLHCLTEVLNAANASRAFLTSDYSQQSEAAICLQKWGVRSKRYV